MNIIIEIMPRLTLSSTLSKPMCKEKEDIDSLIKGLKAVGLK